ncbi:hypothetical protein EJ02DRAFT_422939 [Clathrospora elynae]|uniref:Uncharacterized protein n=1 Tax=Clathrospora elynae TaxID=706981 RepID=A0A6A5SMY8_9PLEO|nr:hypothetical protein EJ02DRAFT_422939 [Clathrospora elynae]
MAAASTTEAKTEASQCPTPRRCGMSRKNVVVQQPAPLMPELSLAEEDEALIVPDSNQVPVPTTALAPAPTSAPMMPELSAAKEEKALSFLEYLQQDVDYPIDPKNLYMQQAVEETPKQPEEIDAAVAAAAVKEETANDTHAFRTPAPPQRPGTNDGMEISGTAPGHTNLPSTIFCREEKPTVHAVVPSRHGGMISSRYAYIGQEEAIPALQSRCSPGPSPYAAEFRASAKRLHSKTEDDQTDHGGRESLEKRSRYSQSSDPELSEQLIYFSGKELAPSSREVQKRSGSWSPHDSMTKERQDTGMDSEDKETAEKKKDCIKQESPFDDEPMHMPENLHGTAYFTPSMTPGTSQSPATLQPPTGPPGVERLYQPVLASDGSFIDIFELCAPLQRRDFTNEETLLLNENQARIAEACNGGRRFDPMSGLSPFIRSRLSKQQKCEVRETQTKIKTTWIAKKKQAAVARAAGDMNGRGLRDENGNAAATPAFALPQQAQPARNTHTFALPYLNVAETHETTIFAVKFIQHANQKLSQVPAGLTIQLAMADIAGTPEERLFAEQFELEANNFLAGKNTKESFRLAFSAKDAHDIKHNGVIYQ